MFVSRRRQPESARDRVAAIAARRSAWEKRGAFRVPVEVPVRARALGAPSAALVEARLFNLSASGLRLLSDAEFEIGAELCLELALGEAVRLDVALADDRTSSAAVAPLTELHGRIVDLRFDHARRRWSVGVDLLRSDDATRERLHRFVHRWQLTRLRLLRGD